MSEKPTMAEERATFEAWLAPCMSTERSDKYPDDYASGLTEMAWLAWQGRAALSNPKSQEA